MLISIIVTITIFIIQDWTVKVVFPALISLENSHSNIIKMFLILLIFAFWLFLFIFLFTARQKTAGSIYVGEGNGTPLQYSCLENPMDRGAWWAVVHGVTKSRTWLSDFTFSFHFHASENKMATHSSVLAWRVPGMGEPGGLPSMGLHRVRHDWSDLAAAAYMWCTRNFFKLTKILVLIVLISNS